MTQDRLKELLYYDPETGIFRWKINRGGKVKVGGKAGFYKEDEYSVIGVDHKTYLSHRLVFLYMEGYFPENDIDHINRIKDDNRWCNLREVSHQCNMRNCKLQSNNISGVTGVNYHKGICKWRSIITINDKQIHLGYYKNFYDAVKARWQAEVKYEFPNCNTTSSAYEYLKEHNQLGYTESGGE